MWPILLNASCELEKNVNSPVKVYRYNDTELTNGIVEFNYVLTDFLPPESVHVCSV